jgi:hypothetical protein
VHIGLQMEDDARLGRGDHDGECTADYGTEFSDDVDPNVTRESGIGSPVSPGPGFGGISPGRFPIPDLRARGIRVGPGNQQTAGAVFRFGRDRESGSGPGAARRGFPGLALGSAEFKLVPA